MLSKLINFITKRRKKKLYIQKKRLKFIVFSLAVIFLILNARLVYIYISGVRENRADYAQKYLYDEGGNIRRIPIVDRNKKVIAMDINILALYANLRLVENPSQVALKLTEIFPELEFSYVYERLSSNSKQVLIKRNVTPKEQLRVEQLGVAGLMFEKGLTRIYPSSNLFSHLIGYTDVDGHGIAGLEKQYDSQIKDYKKGRYLKTTLDIRVQGVLREQLALGMLKFKGKAATGIVMDVENGEVLGVVSLPDFNPNRQKFAKEYQKFNRATYGVYEMGSIFKIFTVAMALEKDVVKISDTYNIMEEIRIGKYVIKDKKFSKKVMDVKDIIVYSSNVGAAKIGIASGADIQKEFFKKFGFLDKVDLDFPEVGTPIKQKRWGKVNVITMSYGHGIAVTPMHITQAFARIVNGGIKVTPTLIFKGLEASDISKSNVDDGGDVVGDLGAKDIRVEEFKERVISKKTSKQIREILRSVVTNGTGWRANSLGYLVGGKTGTAEKVVVGGYSETKMRTSFIAGFPMNKPRYVVFIMIDDPDGKEMGRMNTGSAIAAPIASKVIENIAPILGVRPVIERIE
jgi:cell division protein FtsI (penicillin-binding protein 3)